MSAPTKAALSMAGLIADAPLPPAFGTGPMRDTPAPPAASLGGATQGTGRIGGIPKGRDVAQHITHHVDSIKFNLKHAAAHTKEATTKASQLASFLSRAKGFSSHAKRMKGK